VLSKLIRKFGGRRPALAFAGYALSGRLGLYRRYARVDWTAVRRLVFVCSGNICRSPFAAEYCRAAGSQVASFGLDGASGYPANADALRIAKSRGTDLSTHVATNVQQFEARDGDLLLAMEPSQLLRMNRLPRTTHSQSTLLGLWCSGSRPYIPDPYGRDDACFEHVFAMIEDAADRLLSERASAAGR